MLLALFAAADVRYVVARARLVDSRTQAIGWLLRHRPRQQPLTILAETPLHPQEMLLLGPRIEVQPWELARAAVERAEPRFLLVPDVAHLDGRPLMAPAERQSLLRSYRLRATFGDGLGPASGAFFLDNRLRVFVFERRPGARRPRRAATSAETGANSSSGKFSSLTQNSPSPPAPHSS